jgi:hypothetical protein
MNVTAHFEIAGQGSDLRMPTGCPHRYVIEPFIASDALSIAVGRGGTAMLSHNDVNGFLEVTIGVYGMAGYMHAMTPSVMVKRGSILSYEEKFETGGAVSATPLPAELARPEALAACSSPRSRGCALHSLLALTIGLLMQAS